MLKCVPAYSKFSKVLGSVLFALFTITETSVYTNIALPLYGKFVVLTYWRGLLTRLRTGDA